MKLELAVVLFLPNLAISPAISRVSKIEAVMLSHDPAKNNSGAYATPLLPLAMCSGSGSQGLTKTWGAPPPRQPIPQPPSLPGHPSSSCSEDPDPGQYGMLGSKSTLTQTSPLCDLGQIALPLCPLVFSVEWGK